MKHTKQMYFALVVPATKGGDYQLSFTIGEEEHYIKELKYAEELVDLINEHKGYLTTPPE